MGTRIWHQSLTDLDRLPHYASHLQAHARRIVADDTTVDVHGLAPGTYPEGVAPIEVLHHPGAEHLLGVQLLAAVTRAEREGYDAVTVGCFFDPILAELRAAVDIPVLALAESSLAMAVTAGGSIALLTISAANRRRLLELVERYGAGGRVASVIDLLDAVTEDELDAGFADPGPLRTRLETLVAERAGDADLVVPGENVLNSLLVDAGAVELAGRPVLDAYAALLVNAEAAVALHRRTGLRAGRAGRRAPPAVMAAAAAAARAALAPPAGPRHPDQGDRP